MEQELITCRERDGFECNDLGLGARRKRSHRAAVHRITVSSPERAKSDDGVGSDISFLQIKRGRSWGSRTFGTPHWRNELA